MFKRRRSLPRIELCVCGHVLSLEATSCPFCGRVLRDATDWGKTRIRRKANEAAEPLVFLKTEAD